MRWFFRPIDIAVFCINVMETHFFFPHLRISGCDIRGHVTSSRQGTSNVWTEEETYEKVLVTMTLCLLISQKYILVSCKMCRCCSIGELQDYDDLETEKVTDISFLIVSYTWSLNWGNWTGFWQMFCFSTSFPSFLKHWLYSPTYSIKVFFLRISAISAVM